MRLQHILGTLCLLLAPNTTALPIINAGQGVVLSPNTTHKEEPQHSIFPKKVMEDAPYSFDENKLRSAMKMPSNFTFGEKEAIILVPGTANAAETSYAGVIKLLADSPSMETVALEIPGSSMTDCQETAEYVAYAINYLSEMSNGKNVSVIAWSQGTIDTQWALKYWPSTRSIVNDFIALSPDFNGSTVGHGWADWFRWAPAVYQQDADSKFISTLRADGGDSAYVPTTAIYSNDDEVVIPQGWDNASGSLKDEREIGRSNILLQSICNNLPAGTSVGHTGMLTNSLAIALTMDALSHPGPANVSRIDRTTVCAQEISPGLKEVDTTNLGHLFWLVGNSFGWSTKEPEIKAYAS